MNEEEIISIIEKNTAEKAIYALLEEYEKNENKTIEKYLKKLLLPYKDGSIGIAQINPKVGDI